MKSFLNHTSIIFLTFMLLASFSSKTLKAQETQLSLYEYSPLYLNPALTGSFHGKWRAFVNYRNQQAAAANAFTSATAGFDARLLLFNQRIGAGLYFVNDEAGIGGLNYSKIYASASLEKRISDNFLTFALQGGFVSGKRNDWYVWNPDSRAYDAPNGEEDFGDNASYIDINAGLLWKRKWKIIEPQVGISLNHLNGPNTSFQTDGEQKEEIKISIHASSLVKYTDKIHFTPMLFMTAQGGESFTMLGTDASYNIIGLSRVKRVFAGAYLRNGILDGIEALALRAGTTVGNIDLALNYDIALADLSKSGKMGAFEVALIYRNIGLVLNSYSIPCERY